MRQKGWIAAVVFCVCAALAAALGTVAATGSAQPVRLTAAGSSGVMGGTAGLDVSVDGAEALVSGKLVLNYDRTLLEYTGHTAGAALRGAVVSVSANTPGQIVIAFVSNAPADVSGLLCSVTFKILSDRYAQIPVTLEARHLTQADGSAYTEADVQITDGSVTVLQQEPVTQRGDVNGDGAIDETDRNLLIAYILRRETNATGLDVNRDGHSDVTDLAQIIDRIGQTPST